MRAESATENLGGLAMLNALSTALFAIALRLASEAIEPKSGSWVIATMGRIGAFDGDEHNSFDAFASPGG
jgi:AraC family transcriptional activator of mtrCDE